MFGRYVKSDGHATAVFPFKVLAHSFGLGAGFPAFDGTKEISHNNNVRRLLGDLKRQVLLNVEGASAKAHQKAEHYASALDDQLRICDDTDRMINALMGKRDTSAVSIEKGETMAFREGTTAKGWGVYRNAPWHFVGLFPTQQAAEEKAKQMGADYLVRRGENRVGTDDFVWTSQENPGH